MLRGVRALAVGNLFPPHHLGGYELVWRSATRHLRSRGHEVRVLTTETRFDHAAGDEDGDVHRELRWWWRDHAFPRRSLRERLAIERHNAAVFDRHVAELRPDVVTWWSMGGMSLSLLERARRHGLPSVAFVHDDWLDYGPRADAWLRLFAGRPRLARLVERATGVPAAVDFPAATRYVFVSQTTRRHAVAARGELRDTGIAHSGIDPAFLDPRPEQGWAWRLLYVGRVDARKGVETAVAALTHLPEAATLTLAGEGDDETRRGLLTLADRLGVASRVRLLGPVDREALPDLYVAADVVVFPVLWEEPWGLVPLEAMALARPVVATGRGGSGEYLRGGENSLLHPPGDAAALANAVKLLAEDPQLRARLREAGLATAAGHTADVFDATVEHELELALGGVARRGAPAQVPGDLA
jgi:glycosyltransferase involved in cell wall biosynthesis